MSSKETLGKGDWRAAVELLIRWEKGAGHLDDLLESVDPGRLRWLVMEVFRRWLVIGALLEGRMRREPRPKVRQLLRLALGESLAHPEESAKVVHHAGELGGILGLSPAERGFVNAVLRSCLRAGLPDAAEVEASHPEWMVERWREQFGQEATRRLLQWNQEAGSLYIHSPVCPAYAETTEWPNYYRVPPGRFREALPDLSHGSAYVQDPFARIPVELLDPQPGERVLDLCAAPGGKTRLIAGAMKGKGTLTAVDRPGPRMERLRENISKIPGKSVAVLAEAVENLRPSPFGGPVDGLLIDVPCSNTGVMQKRPDVKLRLRREDIDTQASCQLKLLHHAAKLVRPGGRLVYSTCSLEAEENELLVAAFLESSPHWHLGRSVLSRPWECHHDGGGAFLLTREMSR
ncbi:MAG: RsmB/NOP family class I SAM-dependent RNA methyltransferase [Puniceicoccaceae bacterium]